MSKFDYMIFTGGTHNEFVAHAKKYTKEQTAELAQTETNRTNISIEQIEKRWCRYYVRVPDWCGYDEEGGCYAYCKKEEKGSFPVHVVELENLAEH